MHYDHLEVIWVRIGTPDREPRSISSLAMDQIYLFNAWLFKEKIHSVRTMVSGAGHYEGLFLKEDWVKIEKWLVEHGFNNGPTQPNESNRVLAIDG